MRRDMEAEGKLRSGCVPMCGAPSHDVAPRHVSVGVSGAALRVLIGDMAGWDAALGTGLGSVRRCDELRAGATARGRSRRPLWWR